MEFRSALRGRERVSFFVDGNIDSGLDKLRGGTRAAFRLDSGFVYTELDHFLFACDIRGAQTFLTLL